MRFLAGWFWGGSEVMSMIRGSVVGMKFERKSSKSAAKVELNFPSLLCRFISDIRLNLHYRHGEELSSENHRHGNE